MPRCKGESFDDFLAEKLGRIEYVLNLLTHKENTMAQTLQDLQDAIAAVSEAVAADAEQDKAVIALIEKILAKQNENPGQPVDFTPFVSALSDAVASLKGSNDSIQTEINKANPPPVA